jgi:hypothetical protein
MRQSRASRGIVVVCLALTIACARDRGPAAGPIAVEALVATQAAPAFVRVRGFSGSELSGLRDARFDEATWHAIVRVTVAENDAAAVAGRYLVTDQAVEFRPHFPFDLGRAYIVRVDPGRLPSPRAEAVVTAPIHFGTSSGLPSTNVTVVYPSAGVWPENMLRFYLHFSAPMARGQGVKYVHLLDEADHEIPDAILAAYADLWNPAATRLTVFFDPGRVKRGVGPNMALGRAIVAGRRYTIAIDAAWPDAQGQPLTAPFRQAFTAGPAAYRALETTSWRWTVPPAGGRDALVVTFPSALDHALLERAIGVKSADGHDLAGHIAIGPGEKNWSFTPDQPWLPGSYVLSVLTVLEDPAGNKIGRAFEVMSTDGPAQSPVDQAEIVRLPFAIK